MSVLWRPLCMAVLLVAAILTCPNGLAADPTREYVTNTQGQVVLVRETTVEADGGKTVREITLNQSLQATGAVTLTYDNTDRLLTIVDAGGATTRYTYDAQGRISQVDWRNQQQFTISYTNDGAVGSLNGVVYRTDWNGSAATAVPVWSGRVLQLPTDPPQVLIPDPLAATN